MRGKARLSGSCRARARITPAYAGKSGFQTVTANAVQDHPRLCGEKGISGTLAGTGAGSPPPMRGKVRFDNGKIERKGDHPRLCGEKSQTMLHDFAEKGSPPPMRGKGRSEGRYYRNVRITPAYAGKSFPEFHPVPELRDHPRLCGEKASRNDFPNIVKGSPPPMRGKGAVSDCRCFV